MDNRWTEILAELNGEPSPRIEKENLILKQQLDRYLAGIRFNYNAVVLSAYPVPRYIEPGVFVSESPHYPNIPFEVVSDFELIDPFPPEPSDNEIPNIIEFPGTRK